MAEIVLVTVTKSYPDGAMAVKELSLTIAEGEFIILVGPFRLWQVYNAEYDCRTGGYIVWRVAYRR